MHHGCLFEVKMVQEIKVHGWTKRDVTIKCQILLLVEDVHIYSILKPSWQVLPYMCIKEKKRADQNINLCQNNNGTQELASSMHHQPAFVSSLLII